MSKRIMIIEDDVDLRFGVAELLRLEGYDVVTANNGVDAFEKLREDDGEVGLIFLDLMMPKMDGWEFREKQLDDPEFADIPVILLSGASQLEDESEDLRADDYLTKPVKADKLIDMADQYCVDEA